MTEAVKYAIVIDNSADLPANFLTRYANIYVARNLIHFHDTTYFATELSLKEIFKDVDTANTFPKTSAPPLSEFITLFKKLIPTHTAVFAILPPERLSASLKTALSAKNELSAEDQKKIFVINSHQGSIGIGVLVKCLHDLIQEKKTEKPADIAQIIEEIGKQITLIGTIRTLDYLLKGGRIGRAKWLLGSLLKYQPLFQLKNDEVQPLGRTRSREKALKLLVEHTLTHIQTETKLCKNIIIIGHVLAEEEALTLKNTFTSQLSDLEIEIAEMNSLVGIHTGPGTIAVAYLS